MSRQGVSELLATDLFPDLNAEIDRRIMHSEQRIKLWVVGSIVAHLLGLGAAAIPVVFYLGQISRDISSATLQLSAQQDELRTANQSMGDWRRERMVWEARVEQYLESRGFRTGPPNPEN